MALLKIRIIQHHHFIEGNEYSVYLEQPQLDARIIIAPLVKQDKYLDLCESINGLKIRLELLGNKVVFVNEFQQDPNFDSYEEAMCHMMNKK